MPKRQAAPSPTLDRKLEIISRIRAGATQKSVSTEFRIKLYLVGKIWRGREAIETDERAEALQQVRKRRMSGRSSGGGSSGNEGEMSSGLDSTRWVNMLLFLDELIYSFFKISSKQAVIRLEMLWSKTPFSKYYVEVACEGKMWRTCMW